MSAHFHDPIGRHTHGPRIAFHPPKELVFAPVPKAASAHHQSAHLPPLGAHHSAVANAAAHALHVSGLGRLASRFGLSSQLRSLINRVVAKVVAIFEGL